MRNANKLTLILWMLFPLLATAQVPPPITRSVLTTNIPAFGAAGQALFRIAVPPYLNWSNVVASGGLSISDSNNIINLASNYTYAVSNYAYTASNALSGQIVTSSNSVLNASSNYTFSVSNTLAGQIVTASNAVLNAASNYTFAVSNLVVASTNGQFIEKTGGVGTNTTIRQVNQTGPALTIGTNAGAVFGIMGVTNGPSPYLVQVGSGMLAANSGGTNMLIGGTNGNWAMAGNLNVVSKISIGNTTPTVPLHILTPAIASTREYIQKSFLSDGGNSCFFVYNGTSADNFFIPSFGGIYDSDSNRVSLQFVGFITAANDVVIPTVPVIRYAAYTASSATDPTTAIFYTIANRNLFAWSGGSGTSGNVDWMTMDARGQLGLNTNVPFARLHVVGAGTNQFVQKWDYTNNLSLATIDTNGVLTVKSNLILSSVRWVDSPVQLFWAATGPTAPSAIPVVPGSQILGSGFSVGGIGTEKVYGSFQVNHNVCASNASVYTEHHIHVSPTNAPSAGSSNIAFTIVYDWANIGGTRFGPYTNTVQIGLTAQTYNNLIEFGHQTNFFPGVSAVSRCTIYRSAATSNEFNATVILDGVDVHYPIDRLGSASDTAP